MKPYYETELGKLYHGDCLQIMPMLEPVDLVLTDPPYGIGEDGGLKARYRKGDGRTKGIIKHEKMKWDSKRPPKRCFELIRRTKLIMIFGGNYFADLLPVSSGWLYWDKQIGGDFSDGELIYTNRNGALRSISMHPFTGLRGGKDRVHPTQKPVGLMQWCIGFSNGAQKILDPFLGSGTTAIVCERLKRKWIGIEIEEKYCEIAAKRIEQEIKQLKLF